jgi:hypothetical protein
MIEFFVPDRRKSLLLVLLLGLSVGESAPAKKTECPQFRQLADQKARQGPYRPADFSPSERWDQQRKVGPYPKWASDAANQAHTAESSGASLSDVLDEVARARGDLAIQMDSKEVTADSNPFGKVRESREISTIYRRPESVLDRELEDTLRRLYPRFDQPTGPVIVFSAKYPSGKPIGFTEYLPQSGKPIKASEIIYNSSGLKVLHPTARASQRILKDSLARLEKIRAHPEIPREKRLKEFAAAMYGYYNAMPFARGSAAIGRSFFAGLYSSFFQTKIPSLPDAVDIRAMLSTQQDFVKTMVPYLR